MSDIRRRPVTCRLLLLTLFMLFSCGRGTQDGEPSNASDSQSLRTTGQTSVYECNDGYNFVAKVEGDKVWLFLPTQTISLPRVPSASGVKFSEGSATFWSKGDEASLDLGNNSYRGCKNNRAKAICEDTKLRGVDFRAVGNEPGWSLELREKQKIVLVTDYGNNQYLFATPVAEIDQSARTAKYEVQDSEHSLAITLKAEPCQDSMSGESFETTVRLVLNGGQLTGCGRALH